jgi:hypothetical protein
MGLGSSAVLDETTAAQFRADTAGKVLTTDKVWGAAVSVALTPGATVNIDLNTGLNFTLAMGGNYTLANPTNGKDGQSGKIEITQDATGSRTLAYGTNWLFAGGSDPSPFDLPCQSPATCCSTKCWPTVEAPRLARQGGSG